MELNFRLRCAMAGSLAFYAAPRGADWSLAPHIYRRDWFEPGYQAMTNRRLASAAPLDHENSAVGQLDIRQHSAGRLGANRQQCEGWGKTQFAWRTDHFGFHSARNSVLRSIVP